MKYLPWKMRLPFYGGYTFHYQLRAALPAGLCWGIIQLQGVVLRKTLGAEPEVLALLTSLTLLPFLLSPFWSRYLSRHNPRTAIIVAGLVGYPPLLIMAFTTSPILFIFVAAMPILAESAFLPLRNRIFEHNYASGVRGRAFGCAAASGMLVSVVAAQVSGLIMDLDENAYRYLFPVAGAAGFYSLFTIARIKIRRFRNDVGRCEKQNHSGIGRSLLESARDVFTTLRDNPGFRKYERNFFIYGIGFLMTQPVVVVFVVSRLNAAYSSAAAAILVVPPVVQMICLPVWGRVLDRAGALRTSGIAFLLLTIWAMLLFTAAVETSLLLFFFAYAVFGTAMSGVQIVWNLGSIEFAGRRSPGDAAVPGEAGRFMSVHTMLVGVRALIAPAFGVASLYMFGVKWAFAIAAGLFATAFFLMFRLSSRVRKNMRGDAAQL